MPEEKIWRNGCQARVARYGRSPSKHFTHCFFTFTQAAISVNCADTICHCPCRLTQTRLTLTILLSCLVNLALITAVSPYIRTFTSSYFRSPVGFVTITFMTDLSEISPRGLT